MAAAMVAGLIQKKSYTPQQIACLSGSGLSAQKLSQQWGLATIQHTQLQQTQIDTVILACKPQQMDAIDPRIIEATQGTLLLSVLAGTPISRLQTHFGAARNCIRTMPNTPGRIGAGVTAYASEAPLTTTDQATLETLLQALGCYYKVDEDQLDAVTALSGSGPAYVFQFVEALQAAGSEMGLESELANALAVETLLGSAQLLKNSTDSPSQLRQAVTSPNGTTAAALDVLNQSNFNHIILQALQAAKARSQALAKA
jgi:pyrroline-5-carboxylate reductase